MNQKLYSGFLFLLSLFALTGLTAQAQVLVEVPHFRTISSGERTVFYTVTLKNATSLTATSDASWATATVTNVSDNVKTIRLHATENTGGSGRTATITFTADGVSQTMSFAQASSTYDDSSLSALTDTEIKPGTVGTYSWANTEQYYSYGGTTITAPFSNLFDGDYSTIWESQWTNNKFEVSSSNPAILTIGFTSLTEVDYVSYIPRTGVSNGNWGEVDVYINTRATRTKSNDSDSYWTLLGSYDLEQLDVPTSFAIGRQVYGVRFKVKSAYPGTVSGAEIEIGKANSSANFANYFKDTDWTELAEGVDQTTINSVSNVFMKNFMQSLLDGTYSTDYRLATATCYRDPNTLSSEWNAPGKYYDRTGTVTGIHVPAGATLAVYVPVAATTGSRMALRVINWSSTDADHWEPTDTYSAPLHQGLNIIKTGCSGDGLAYIQYYTSDAAENLSNYPDLKVHFLNAPVNGYLSEDKTNDEMYNLCSNALNAHMDISGNRVHAVWTAAGLRNYCKDSNGNAKGYRQYIRLLEQWVEWEQEMVGFNKYNLKPNTRTLAFVNYAYYMYQSTLGVSFNKDQEVNVLNCKTLMKDDYDVSWGYTHEWGHQLQMNPYFMWASCDEVTNNVLPYYCLTRLGYSDIGHGVTPETGTAIYNGTEGDVLKALDATEYARTGKTKSYNTRANAYKNRSVFNWNDKLYNLCEAMLDSTWTDKTVHGVKSFDFTNYSKARPFCALYDYAVNTLGIADFFPDLYQALRMTDTDVTTGSTVEKSDGIDKYELLAAAQNGNKNGARSTFMSNYPSSVWTTNAYVSSSPSWTQNSVPFIMNFIRKASRLTGYNLFPYFEKCGFLRQVAYRDYQGRWYLMTEDMYDEFKSDMDALGLETCDDTMVKAILTKSLTTTSAPASINNN